MNRVFFIFLLVSSSLITACGGGFELPPVRPEGAVSGTVVDGNISNATVRVFTIENGNKGVLLGEAISADDGSYLLKIRAKSQSVLIEISGGSYSEQASGEVVNLSEGEVLRTVAFYRSGESLSMMVTPVTHLAAGYALFKMEQGVTPADAVKASLTELSEIFGFDISNTRPLNIAEENTERTVLDSESEYGFFLAALSGWTKWVSQQQSADIHSPYDSIGAAQIFYDDIRADGFLDGRGLDKARREKMDLFYGKVPISADVYRISLAQHMLAMASSPANKSSIKAPQLLEYAHGLASSHSPVFGTLVPGVLDEKGPPLYALEKEMDFKNTNFRFAAAVGGITGAESVEFYVDDSYAGNAENPLRPMIDIDTAAYSDGLHKIRVVATNVFGNTSDASFQYIFDNTGPSITLASPLVTNQSVYDLGGTYVDLGVGVRQLLVQGEMAELMEDGGWKSKVSLVPGMNEIPIEIIDQLDNRKQQAVFVTLDQIPPSINTDRGHGEAFFSDGNGSVLRKLDNDNTVNPIIIDTRNISLKGVGIGRELLSASNIPFFAFTPDDGSVEGVSTKPDMLTVYRRYIKGDQLVSDWQKMTSVDQEYLLPLVSENLAPEWAVSSKNDTHVIDVKVQDEAGNVTESRFNFKVDFRVPNIEDTDFEIVNSTEFQKYDGAGFWNRTELNNRLIPAVRYRYTNNTGYAIYISPGDDTAHAVSRTFDEAQRFNKVIWTVTPQWQISKIENALVTDECPTSSSANTVSVNQIYNYSSTGWELRKLPKSFLSDPMDVSIDFPKSYEEGWKEHHFDTEFAPANVSVPTLDPGKSNRLVYLYDYITSLTQFSQPGAIYLWTLTDLNSSPPAILKSCEGVSFFRQNLVFTNPVPFFDEDGSSFPRNRLTENLQADQVLFQTERFEIEDVEEGTVTDVNGWYRVPPGHSVWINKIVKLPQLDHYNDVSLLDMNTFSSYAAQRLDKEIDWAINRQLSLSVVHDAGPGNIAAMTQRRVNLSKNTVNFRISR